MNTANVKPRFSSGWLLLALTVAALGLRCFRIQFRSIWLDEAYSLVLGASDFSGILHGAALDIHPPAFYLLLAGWIRIFGTSELASRSLSALCGALLVPVGFYLAKSWANTKAAWWTAGLIAVSPYFLELSRTGRMGSLLALTSALSVYFFWRFIVTGRTLHAAGYWLMTLAAMYTHYFAFLIWGAQNVYVFLGIGKLKLSRPQRRTWGILQLLLVVGYSPWMPVVWEHLDKGGPSWRGAGAAWFEPVHSLYAFLLGTSCWTWIHKVAALAALAVVGGLILWELFQDGSRLLAVMPPRAWGLGAAVVLVPQAVIWMYSVSRLNVFDNRYLGASALMVLAMLAGLMAGLPRFKQILAGGFVLAAWLVPNFNQYFVYGYYDNWREVAGVLKNQVGPDEPVAVFPAWNQAPLEYYLKGQCRLQGLPGTYDPVTGVTTNYFYIDQANAHKLQSLFPSQRRIWLVLVNEGEQQTAVQTWFGEHYRLAGQKHFGGIAVYDFQSQEQP